MQATMQLKAWDFELDAPRNPVPRQHMLVHGHQRTGLQAWPAAVGTRCSAASAARAAAVTSNALVSTSHAFKAPAAMATAAVSSRGAATVSAMPADASGGASHGASEDAQTGRSKTEMRRDAANAAHAAARRDVGIVPAVFIGDVFMVGEGSCRAARGAIEAVLEGREPQLPKEPAVMHTSRAMAEGAQMYAFANAMGITLPGGVQPDDPWKGPRTVQRPGLSAMPLGRVVSVLSKVPGYARLHFNPEQEEDAQKLFLTRAAVDAPSDENRGATVFSVPGVHVMLPSPRGVVRFTPLFLNRQQLYDTVSFVQDLVARHRHVKQPAWFGRRPNVVAHSLPQYIRACGHSNNKPAGGDANLQPWTDDDVSSLRPGVELTCVMAYDAAVELQQQPQQRPDYSNPAYIMEQMSRTFNADILLHGSVTPGMKHGIGVLQFDHDKAFGERPAGADAQMDPVVPNSGVILIGESAEKSTEATDRSPQLHLPGGRRWGIEYATLVDGSVLSCEA